MEESVIKISLFMLSQITYQDQGRKYAEYA